MQDLHPRRVTRRRFLLGGSAAAGAVLLGACGSDQDESSATTSTAGDDAGGLALAQFFGGPMFVAGRELRAPFGLADADGLLTGDKTPSQLSVRLLDPDGAEVGAPIAVPRRAEGLPRPYFPLRTTIDEPGIYTARTEVDGSAAEMQFQVYGPDDVAVIQPGAEVPAVETPTPDDGRGVNPMCTNDPVCPLHDVTLAQALTEGRPLALLVATPAFCQISICGPVLDVLLAAAPEHPGVRFLHAEVYADPAKDLDTQAPVVGALGLHFEPALILANASGAVVERLDTIYDRGELDERLASLA